MTVQKILVFTATFNERHNIEIWIDKVRSLDTACHILVVDDNSPDGTGEYLDQVASTDPDFHIIHRPEKLGIGTAHKLAIEYSLFHGYDVLVTMDADLSHDPAEIPNLLGALKNSDFVIGSRYCPGGSSDYTGYRRLVSSFANGLGHVLLGIPTRECTTSFRAFRLEALRKSGIPNFTNSGYSYFMETIFSIHQAGLRMAELPIQFRDRYHGESKIPRFEIINGARKLLQISARRLTGTKKFKPVKLVKEGCCHCGSPYMSDIYEGSPQVLANSSDAAAYKCTSMDHRGKPHIAQCLHCGLIQIPKDEQPGKLEKLYEDTVDDLYLDNEQGRQVTFAKAFFHMEKYLPSSGRFLEVGAYCGLFLRLVKDKGWETEGVEPSGWAIDMAKKRLDVNIHQGTLASNKERLGSDFDAAAAWDVLEHVQDPYSFLCAVNSHLNDGGVMAFSTLDFDNWFPRFFLKWWPWLMPMHLHYFTRALLNRWLHNAGFEVLEVRRYQHFVTLGYFWEKIINILPRWFGPLMKGLSPLVPKNLLVKVCFGDIKMWIVRKKSVAIIPESGLRYTNPE